MLLFVPRNLLIQYFFDDFLHIFNLVISSIQIKTIMPVLHLRGIEVTFPFKPYQVQIDYMEKVIESLQTHQNAVLESPTGTGKTLCLLCAALAWRKHEVDQLKMRNQVSVLEFFMHIDCAGLCTDMFNCLLLYICFFFKL